MLGSIGRHIFFLSFGLDETSHDRSEPPHEDTA